MSNKLQCPICKKKIGYQSIKKHYTLCREHYIKKFKADKKEKEYKKNSKLQDIVDSVNNIELVNYFAFNVFILRPTRFNS